MNAGEAPPYPHRVARSPLTPALICVASYAVFTAVSVEHLLDGLSPAVLQVPAKLSAYVAAATVMGMVAGLTVAFGLCCGLTLRWLDGPTDVRAIARALGGGLWVLAAYTLVLAAWVTVNPPLPITGEEILSPQLETDASPLAGLPWLRTVQYATLAMFLLVVFLLLSRVADRVSTLISLAFAASTVVALGAGLQALAALLPS